MDELLSMRIGLISKIAKTKPGLGKTAMMKMVFLLQEVYKMPLGYGFEIHIYGPYTPEVMSDIEIADSMGYLSVEAEKRLTSYVYKLNPTDKTGQILKTAEKFLDEYAAPIDAAIVLFAGKTARELEMLTTIVFLYKIYVFNKLDVSIDDIANNVRDIKPHLELDFIKGGYRELEGLGIFSKLAAA
jgi:uncharacterized protein YwgA